MDFLTKELIARYLYSVFSPGVLAAATMTILLFASGAAARTIAWCETIGQAQD